jgi:hypothetical protein
MFRFQGLAHTNIKYIGYCVVSQKKKLFSEISNLYFHYYHNYGVVGISFKSMLLSHEYLLQKSVASIRENIQTLANRNELAVIRESVRSVEKQVDNIRRTGSGGTVSGMYGYNGLEIEKKCNCIQSLYLVCVLK